MMNITFNLPSPYLEEKLIAEGLSRGLVGLKGHILVGGMRISIYNAMPIEGVQALAEFMKEFQEKNSEHRLSPSGSHVSLPENDRFVASRYRKVLRWPRSFHRYPFHQSHRKKDGRKHRNKE